MPDGEIVNLFSGQCGVQMGNAVWELYCMEHGIRPDGKLCVVDDNMQSRYCGPGRDISEPLTSFFQVTTNGHHVPRTVMLDSEPTVVDEVRIGTYRCLFNPDTLVSGLEDAANIFPRGYNAVSQKILGKTTNTIRHEVEKTDNLLALMLYHSFSGGTGSAITCRILEWIEEEYSKKMKIQMSVFPGKAMCTSVVEPYNTVLCCSMADKNSDITVLLDNEALVNMCTDLLKVERPNYTNLNRLSAQVSSGLTAAVRFEGPLTASLNQLSTNLVPYPRLHYLEASLAPIATVDSLSHESVMVHELCNSAFAPENQMLIANLEQARMLSCALLCRGDVSVRDIRNAVIRLKAKGVINLVDWCPTGFKIGLCEQPPAYIPNSCMAPTLRSVIGLYNSTSLMQPIQNLQRKYSVLLRKRSFIHWFLQEGLEEGEILEANEDVTMVVADYQGIEKGLPYVADTMGDKKTDIANASESGDRGEPGISIKEDSAMDNYYDDSNKSDKWQEEDHKSESLNMKTETIKSEQNRESKTEKSGSSPKKSEGSGTPPKETHSEKSGSAPKSEGGSASEKAKDSEPRKSSDSKSSEKKTSSVSKSASETKEEGAKDKEEEAEEEEEDDEDEESEGEEEESEAESETEESETESDT